MPLRVLVVDDDEMSRELLAVLLDADGYAVESADSGAAALEHLRSGGAAYDLILSDMQMPGISGPELAAELRKRSTAAVLLAMSGSKPAPEALAHFDGFLMKPFTVQQLATALDEVRPRLPHAQSDPRPGATPGKVLPMRPPTTQAAETPAINKTIFDQLARALPPRQLNEMYALCINDARERIHRMQVSARGHDSAGFVREAHAIKGSAGMLGATQIHSMASDLEVQGLDGGDGTSEAVNSLDKLSAACDRLERMLGTHA